jgi:hypothetical protein
MQAARQITRRGVGVWIDAEHQALVDSRTEGVDEAPDVGRRRCVPTRCDAGQTRL